MWNGHKHFLIFAPKMWLKCPKEQEWDAEYDPQGWNWWAFKGSQQTLVLKTWLCLISNSFTWPCAMLTSSFPKRKLVLELFLISVLKPGSLVHSRQFVRTTGLDLVVYVKTALCLFSMRVLTFLFVLFRPLGTKHCQFSLARPWSLNITHQVCFHV